MITFCKNITKNDVLIIKKYKISLLFDENEYNIDIGDGFMLIQFRFKNFLSIKDEIIFSTVATARKEHLNNIYQSENKKLLLSSVFYGANASGKTSIIKALNFMQNYVFNSNNLQINQMVPLKRYRFSDDIKEEPAEFDVILLIDGIKYQYGFSATPEKICDEYLYYYPNNKETLVFERKLDQYKFRRSDMKMLNDIASKNISNKLFLSTATNWNYELTRPVYEWFVKDLKVVYDSKDYIDYTISCFEENDERLTTFITDLLNAADLNIDSIDIKVRELTFDEIINHKDYPDFKSKLGDMDKEKIKGKEASVFSNHKVDNKIYRLNFDDESLGTQNIFNISALLYDVLTNGKCLVMDEMDKSIHPLLVKYIISFFHDENINKKGAQLIFNTHDINLLDLEMFRRDQIWFVEKLRDTCNTIIYPLSDYPVRKTDNIAKGYLLGRYGAIPFIESNNKLWEEK